MNARVRGLALALLFLGSLLLIHRWSGDSAAVWLDTLHDQQVVRECVVQSRCTTLGQGASIQGLYVGVGWLDLRSALFQLGLGIDAVHLGLQALEALGVVLVAIAGFELAGTLAGACAAFVLLVVLGRSGATHTAVYNSAPLAFLGAVLLLACLQAVRRPSFRSSTLIALLAAVMADFHTGCALAGATAVLVATYRPERRALAGATAATVFAGTAVVLAPDMWSANARYAIWGGAATRTATHPLARSWTVWLFADPIGVCCVLAMGAWLVAAAARQHSFRKMVDVPVACIAPTWLATVLALGHGVNDMGGKYLAPVKPAAALAVGLCLAALVGRLVARAPAGWSRRAVILALVVLSATWTGTTWWIAATHESHQFARMTMRDLGAVSKTVMERHRWPGEELASHVRAPDGEAVLTGLLYEAGTAWPSGPVWAPDAARETATIVKLDTMELPEPLPDGWVAASRGGDGVTVVVFDQSIFDWDRARLCHDAAAGRVCAHPGGRHDDGTPWSFPGGKLSLHVPMDASRDVVSGAEHVRRVLMPQLAEECGGRVIAVPGENSRIDEDGHGARVRPGPDGAGDAELILEWDVGSSDCLQSQPSPIVPFFIEAGEKAAAVLEPVIRRREAARQGRRP